MVYAKIQRTIVSRAGKTQGLNNGLVPSVTCLYFLFGYFIPIMLIIHYVLLIRMPTYIFLFLFLLTSLVKGQILIDPNQAFKAAQESGKPVLLVFSGSDWCAPCIRFEREILSDASFLRYAESHLILLKADFPQRKTIAQPLRLAYEKLADTYNQEGAFPKIIVVRPDQKALATLAFLKQTPATFVADLQRILN